MSIPQSDLPDPSDDVNEDANLETHVRANRNFDSRQIQHLESEILRTMQSGNSVIDPLFNVGLPDSSVSQSMTSSMASSCYGTSVSMESFTLDTFVTHGSSKGKNEDARYNQRVGCCAKMKRQTGAGIGQDEPGIFGDGNAGQTQNETHALLPDPGPEDANKICLVLDLDETLVHSSFFPLTHADHTFKLGEGENQVMVYMLVRPGAKQFLKELGKLYELVVFTASVQSYADQVIDYIDPGRLVKHRLYRESCTDMGGTFVKDLSKLNRALERVIIIDNSPSAYLLQPYNAISINSWFDSENDNELMLIMEFLKQSHRVKNIYDLFTPE